jgi:hypothetical protein
VELSYPKIYAQCKRNITQVAVEEMFIRYNALALQAYKDHFPRRKKVVMQDLPTEILDDLKQRFEKEYTAFMSRVDKRKQLLNRLLDQIVASADMTPQSEFVTLQVVSGGEYHTQGYGANTYARGKLLFPQEVLISFGFEARIEQFNPHKTSTMEFWDFKLVANCADWQCDAALRMKGTLEAWLVSCGRHNVNPWVYAPMLPETAEYEALVYGKRQA